MTTEEIHQGPLAPATASPAKKTWREKRWERRRRRIWFEELLGWILVPIIVIASYWALKGGLALLGTTPTDVIQMIKTLASSVR